MFTSKNIELTEKQLREFQRIYKQEYGKTISKEMAMDEAVALLNLLGIVLYKGFVS